MNNISVGVALTVWIAMAEREQARRMARPLLLGCCLELPEATPMVVLARSPLSAATSCRHVHMVASHAR